MAAGDIKYVFRYTERIRPSSPTPQNLRTYKLSLLDQLINRLYVPLLSFYNNSPGDHDLDQLKKSLSRALSYIYPFAGRLKDGKTIDCNDEGADFVAAQVENKMSEVIQYPRLDRLRMLFPCSPYPEVVDSTIPLLAVQVTRFSCGGSANTRGLVVDASTTFVPTDLLSSLTALTDRNQIMVAEKYVTKRFIFRGSTVNTIRDRYTQPEHRPSRVVALAAFLWAAVIRATREVDQDFKTHTLTMSMDLRKRFNPPFPTYCLGSINQVVGAGWERGNEGKESSAAVDGGVLVRKVQEAISKIDDNYIQKMHIEGGYLKELMAISNSFSVDKKHNKGLNISSWCKVPFYEVDFGWGKPRWISTILVLKDLAIFMDMDDGGVEVWLGLPQERIRPSSPTPQNLRSHKLSLLDQLINCFYAPILTFYDNSSGDHDHNQLKKSFSRTLSYIYPLAGRLKDGKTIDCNDEGADFVVAQVENKMSEVMQYPRLDRLRMLFPCNPYPEVVDSTLPLLAVQNTRNLVVDTSTTFVPTDLLSSLTALTDRNQVMIVEKYITKRFVFRGSTVNAIRDRYIQPEHRPSRVVALAAFLWAAVIRATREADQDFKTHTLTMSVDLRKRFNPSFPTYCLGSINQVVGARWESSGDGKESAVAVDGGVLIGKVREAISKIDDNYIKKMHIEGGYLKELMAVSNSLSVDKKHNKGLNISSWCKVPFYEVDFGWGKPRWIATILVLKDLAIFMDMDDGGVEVWLGLPQGIMSNLERDEQFLAHLSYSQTVWDYNLHSVMKSKL
nr:vinorine synthase-like [Ipomoea batatas]